MPLYDAAFVINRDSRTDRLATITARAQAAGITFERIRAVEAVDDPPPDWWGKNGHWGGEGHWGCRQSHIKALTEAQRRNLNRVIVFEDDAIIPPDFTTRLRAVVENTPADWLAILPGCTIGSSTQEIAPHVQRVNSCVGCWAYMLSREGIARLRGHWMWERGYVDQDWKSLMAKGRFYAADPIIVKHDNGYSDTACREWRDGNYQ